MKFVSQSIIALFIITFCSEIPSFSQKQILIQAETADTINTGTVDHDDQGYTGTGFVNLDNVLGTYVVWMIRLPESAVYKVTVRFCKWKFR